VADMNGQDSEQTEIDLARDGAPADAIADGEMLAGQVGDAAVLLVRRDGRFYAMGAECSHYGGPLGSGVFDGELVRCPWHHACFDPATGSAARAPALEPVPTYEVSERDGRIYVGEQRPASAVGVDGGEAPPFAEPPRNVVIVGAGAAGAAAAEMLRRERFGGAISMISAESELPYDRPNLSKDYLTGDAPAEWLPLRDEAFYKQHEIELRRNVEVRSIDPLQKQIDLSDGSSLEYDALLLATGSEPIRPPIDGIDRDHVHFLRNVEDSQSIMQAAEAAEHALVVGASFIGTEVAASLRQRGLSVDIVDLEPLPLVRVLGEDFGGFTRSLHEEHGVTFHLECSVEEIGEREAVLDDGTNVPADLVVLGVGVEPRTELAKGANLEVGDGVLVNQYLETTAPGIWAAGDIARWPDRHSRQPIRIEHWVVAERQGQTAARNILGYREPFTDVPFFWSQQYDVTINYVGHAEEWDAVEMDGSPDERDCLARYRLNGRTLATAAINRDVASLRAEIEFERALEDAAVSAGR
jgi:NADPH-dependent 2,4-dienoyl-CoA reductase/sulfur reductase-like enzyme/nitrite reductase/ring-hydroxylating ferredoxin subunit